MFIGCNEEGQQDYIAGLVGLLLARDHVCQKDRLGVLILTSSKDQSVDIYTQLVRADKERKLKISRLGSASYLAPHLEPNQSTKRSEYNRLNEISIENLKNIAESDSLDILVATLSEASILSPWSPVFKPLLVVFQDFELLLDINNRNIERILYSIDSSSKRIWTSRNPQPHIPARMMNLLPDSVDYNHLPAPVPCPAPLEKIQLVGKKNKLCKVIDTVKRNSSKRGVIFCKDATEAKLLTQSLIKEQQRVFLYTSGQQAPPSSWSLLSFKSGPPSVLVCEETALRPVDAKEADYTIWLQEPSNPQDAYYRRRALKPTATVFKFTEV